MSAYYIFYHGLILIALAMAGVAVYKGYRYVLPLAILLFLTLLLELAVEIMLMSEALNFTWLYHVFSIIEYGLFSFYLVHAVNNKRIKTAVRWSTLLFALTGLTISFFLYRFKGFPGININLEGILLFVFSTYVLFTIEPKEERSIYELPNFWISIGILIFFGCTFLFNGIYTKILQMNEERALHLFGIINKPLNIVLYSFIIIGLGCLKTQRKHITPSS